MNTQRILDALNQDVTHELSVILQYLYHHFTAKDPDKPEVINAFRKTAIEEMRHLARLAERVVDLGGTPTATIGQFRQGGDLSRMLRDDIQAERDAIDRYRRHIQICEAEGDSTTRELLAQILADEERHAGVFEAALAPLS